MLSSLLNSGLSVGVSGLFFFSWYRNGPVHSHKIMAVIYCMCAILLVHYSVQRLVQSVLCGFSYPGVGFLAPFVQGFVNRSLQVWIVKNGNMPVSVRVTLAKDSEGE